MRDDGDFAAYLVARRTPVVRMLVMLGCPQMLAEDIALSAFARLRGAWGSVRDSDDIDVQAYRVVLQEWLRARTRRGPDVAAWVEPPAAAAWAGLESMLDRLTPEVRAVLLLRFVADLSDAQVGDAMELPPTEVRDTLAMTEVPSEAVFREASESIDVLSPSLVDVRRRAVERGRRRWSVVAGSAVAFVVVAGLVTWLATRPTEEPDPGLRIAPTARAENPVDVAWFANGELHLDHVVIELPPLQTFVAINGGAVYAEDGAVVFVADDGARTRLGHKESGTPLVGSDEEGWVAWTDTDGLEPELVLYDVTSRERLRTETPVDPTISSLPPLVPVAIDQAQLYYRWGNQSYAVAPEGVAEQLAAGLLDVASATRVFQSDPESIRMEQSFFSTITTALGVGAQLSADGDFVLTRTADDRSSYGTVRVYDSRSGSELPSGLTNEDVAIAAAFGPDETVTYIIARAEDRPSADGFVRQSFSGALELRTCPLGFGSCTTDAKFPSTGSVALLSVS